MLAKTIGEFKPIDITGFLIPWYLCINQPVLVLNQLQPEEIPLLPIFSTVEKLTMALTWIRPKRKTSIKQIGDGIEFLMPLQDKVLVAVDAYQKDGHKIGFIGVKLC